MTLSDAIVPVAIVAQAEITSPAFVQGLINFGALGLWVLWLLWRDKRESERQDRRHEENQLALRRIEDAYRTGTDLMIVGLGGIKEMDSRFTSLLEKIKTANAPTN